jgi:hypothetical protein
MLDRIILEGLTTYRKRMNLKGAVPIVCIGVARGELVMCLTEEVGLDATVSILRHTLAALEAQAESTTILKGVGS